MLVLIYLFIILLLYLIKKKQNFVQALLETFLTRKLQCLKLFARHYKPPLITPNKLQSYDHKHVFVTR